MVSIDGGYVWPYIMFGGIGKHYDGGTIENNSYFSNGFISCHSNRVTVRALSPPSVCQLRFSVPTATSQLLLDSVSFKVLTL